MVEVLVLCEGKSDVHFIKGLIEGSHEKVKFLEGSDDLDRIARDGYYRKIVCGIGGKGHLSKRAKNMISSFRSSKGKIRFLVIGYWKIYTMILRNSLVRTTSSPRRNPIFKREKMR